MIGNDPAEGAVDAVIDSLCDRGGFDAWWDEVGEFHDEIRRELTGVVRDFYPD